MQRARPPRRARHDVRPVAGEHDAIAERWRPARSTCGRSGPSPTTSRRRAGKRCRSSARAAIATSWAFSGRSDDTSPRRGRPRARPSSSRTRAPAPRLARTAADAVVHDHDAVRSVGAEGEVGQRARSRDRDDPRRVGRAGRRSIMRVLTRRAASRAGRANGWSRRSGNPASAPPGRRAGPRSRGGCARGRDAHRRGGGGRAGTPRRPAAAGCRRTRGSMPHARSRSAT